MMKTKASHMGHPLCTERERDTTENITSTQPRWRAVKAALQLNIRTRNESKFPMIPTGTRTGK